MFLQVVSKSSVAFLIIAVSTPSPCCHSSALFITPASLSSSKAAVGHCSYLKNTEESMDEPEQNKPHRFQPWRAVLDKFKRKPPKIIEITTLEELDRAFSNPLLSGDAILKSNVVKGDTQKIGSPNSPDFVHPVLQLLHKRKSNTHTKEDGFKVALAIEGGGMRGCVSARMVAAIYFLGLEDCHDVVYGSSAGSLIGAYFITHKLPWFGPEVYYDVLTTAGSNFIETRRLLRALGLGLLDPRLLKDVITRRNHGKPVLQLSYLLEEAIQNIRPLNWTKFVEMQQTQPLKVVASGLKNEKAFVFDMEKKSFTTLKELALCMHASMLLPGIAGPVMNIGRTNKTEQLQQILRNNKDSLLDEFEPLVDALVYEPLPYRSAVAEGATHVVVLRTRPDGADVLGKPSFFEKLMMQRFFLRKNRLPNIYKRMRRQEHKRLYAEDVITLNNAVHDSTDYKDTTLPHLLPIAMPPGSTEITRLETRRENILEGVRRGFARAYDALVEDSRERGRGMIVAKQCFPDIILDYDPLEVIVKTSSAFEVYLNKKNPKDAEDILSKAKRQSLKVFI